MINRVTLLGNLGADPELRSTGSGSAVASIRLATTDRVKDKDGQWTDRTEWHNVVVWGKTAENVHQYAKKGKQLYIEGRLQTRKWQDKEGHDRYSTEVVAEVVKFLGGRQGEDGEQAPQGGRGGASGGRAESRPDASPAQGGSGRQAPSGRDWDDGDLPF